MCGNEKVAWEYLELTMAYNIPTVSLVTTIIYRFTAHALYKASPGHWLLDG